MKLTLLLTCTVILFASICLGDCDNPPTPGFCEELNDNCDIVKIDPGPKPEGCFKLDENCEWSPYTPDCKDEQEEVNKLEVILCALAARIAMLNLQLSKMEKWCGCKQHWYLCVFVPPDSAIPPDDPCGEVERIKAKIEEAEKEVEKIREMLEEAKKALENCLNCK